RSCQHQGPNLTEAAMAKQADAHRAVTETDLQIVERAIADHEKFQANLFTLQRVLTELGPLDVANARRNVEHEQSRLDDVRKQADAAQDVLTQLEKQIADKKRELAETEVTIKDKIREAELFNERCQNLRALLAAA